MEPMDGWILLLALAVVAWSFKTRSERQRMALLASHLRALEIEKLMETLSHGYQRALDEDDAGRRQALWGLWAPAEQKVAEHIERLAKGFEQVSETDRWVLRADWPVADLLRLLGRAWPDLLARHSVDLCALLALHAHAVRQAVDDGGRAPSARAHRLLAELMLLQHSCHWFCKSRNVASARLLLRHRTPYATVLDSVAPETRRDYLALTQG